MAGPVGDLAQLAGPGNLAAPNSQADRFIVSARRGTDKYQNFYFAAVSRLT